MINGEPKVRSLGKGLAGIVSGCKSHGRKIMYSSAGSRVGVGVGWGGASTTPPPPRRTPLDYVHECVFRNSTTRIVADQWYSPLLLAPQKYFWIRP